MIKKKLNHEVMVIPAVEMLCDSVELHQGRRRCRPVHTLPIVGHVSNIGKPSLYFPEVSLHLIAFIICHYRIYSPYFPTSHTC